MAADRDTIGTALFIGGPRDGELTPAFADDPPSLRAPAVQYSAPITAEYLATLSQAALPVCEYRQAVFHTPTRDFYFWRAPELTPDDLMVRLITAYHDRNTPPCRSTD
jgi:hypothetical protein